MYKSMNVKLVVLLLGCLAAGGANSLTFNYLDSKPSCVSLTVSTTGAITCNTAGTTTIPLNFQNPLSCPGGLAVSGSTGAVKCASSTLPVCTLGASPASVAPGGTVTLTASCTNTPTSYGWTTAAGLAPGAGNTATVTVPMTTVPGVYAYSVTGTNAQGTGNVASALVKVGVSSFKGPFAYVAHQASAAPSPGTVSVIDTSTNTVATTIPVGVYPAGVAVNNAGTRAYVTNAGHNTVSVIDTLSNTVIKTIDVGVSPLGLAVNTAGTKVYVANSGANTVSVIDTSNNAVTATVNVGVNPYGVATNQAGTRVYVTNYGGDTVSVIDTTVNPNTVSGVSVGSKPYGLAVAGALVYVANSAASTVSVIDTSVSPNAVSTVGVGANPRGIAVNPAGNIVYVTNDGDRTVSVIDAATKTVTATVTVGVLPSFVAFNPTGTLAYVLNQGDNTVSVIDTAANAAVAPAALPVGPGGLYAFGKFMAGAADNRLGLWWNPSESGWGMSVVQHGSMIFNTFYTYDQAGSPVWYVMSSCPLADTSCTGAIFQVTGGTPPTKPWNGSGKVVKNVGTGTLTFVDANTATFSYTINGVAGSKSIVKQMFANGTTPPVVDYTDLWWNPSESGWGVALTHQYGTMFATWYSYDSNGNAVWYVASNCTVAGSACTGDLYQVTGGSPLTSTWNGTNKVVSKVGQIEFIFTDANNMTMNYFINGVQGTKNITRQSF